MNSAVKFICNNEEISVNIHPATTLLDYIRKQLRLTGTKESCREGDCGSCAVLVGQLVGGEVNYCVENSCILPIGAIHGKHIVTIEGLSSETLNTIQKIFVEEGATQCGFCTPGFIISLTGYLLSNPETDYADAINSLDGNICRCTGYSSIRRVAAKVLQYMDEDGDNSTNHFQKLMDKKIIPEYFKTIASRLTNIEPLIFPEEIPSQKIIGGGTDLFVQRWEELLHSDVKFLHKENEDDFIFVREGRVFINSRTTVNEFMHSPVIGNVIPQIKEFLKLFGSNPIRNRATIGGNIVNASPIGDISNFLLAFDSTLHLRNSGNEREVELKKFYIDYKKCDLRPGEFIDKISFALPDKKYHLNFEKVSRRTYLDIASVNTTILIAEENMKIKKIHLSAGGVFPYPLYLSRTSEYLKGKIISEKIIGEAVKIAKEEIKPISDARGSVEYKRLLLGQLIKAHFIKLFLRLFDVEELA
ncbi:MAG: FAD binding domain-containing protein [bacterium]